MKRIEIMAKMQEENVAEEILNFLTEHEIYEKLTGRKWEEKCDS